MNKEKTKQILAQVKQDYNQIAKEFSNTRKRPWPEFTFFAKEISKKSHILDLGCGNGRFYNFLKKYLKVPVLPHYLGVDQSENLLAEAKKLNPEAKFKQGTIQNAMKFGRKQWDIILLLAVLHHLPTKELQKESLKQIQNLLKDNGKLIISVWDLNQKKYLRARFIAILKNFFSFGQFRRQDLFIPWGKTKIQRYYYAFERKEIENLLQESGFKIIRRIVGNNYNYICKPLNKKPEQSPEIKKILGIKIHNITLKQALQICEKNLKKPEKTFICTPNPEILLKALKNQQLKEILNNSATINIPDGTGLLWAAKWQKTPLQERVTGTDLMRAICLKSEISQQGVFFLGGGPGVAQKAAENLQKQNPKLKIAGISALSPTPKDRLKILQLINKSGAKILFVAFGAPQQEIWLQENLPELTKITIAMGVGGAFDFYAGKKKRAPIFMQKTGLEWLFRLIQEPLRLKRIYNAVILFPITFLKNNKKN